LGTLAVALGLNAIAYSFFNAYVVKPAAVHDPGTLLVPTFSSVRTQLVQRFRFPQQQRSEMHVCLIRVVRPAAKLQIRNGRFSTISEGHDMVELEQAALAAPAVCSDKSASPTVALPHFPFDRRRHMAGAGSRIRLSPRPSGLRDLLLLEFRQQPRQGARTFSSNR
jgi:hypothetical protein